MPPSGSSLFERGGWLEHVSYVSLLTWPAAVRGVTVNVCVCVCVKCEVRKEGFKPQLRLVTIHSHLGLL